MQWHAFGQDHGNLFEIIEAGAGIAANDRFGDESRIARQARPVTASKDQLPL